MTSLTSRGISYQASAFETVETDWQATCLGCQANVNSPVKTAVALLEDIQFFGCQTVPHNLERNIRLDVVGWATARAGASATSHKPYLVEFSS